MPPSDIVPVQKGGPPADRGSRGSPRTEVLMHFDVSAGLKRVIGRDLITDDEVAIFELVKNSFDAEATNVQILFREQSIWLVDNGSGMSHEDLTGKWLYVAHSAKRAKEDETFRDEIAVRRHYAGSKGIGRFSSDRLGQSLILQTREVTALRSDVHRLEIDWQAFEEDETAQFSTVPVLYSKAKEFNLPTGITIHDHGTALEIRGTRVVWDRDKILHLKTSLAKLINPFGSATDAFSIEIIAPAEIEDDEVVRLSAAERGEEPISNNVVNGEVGNFIFSTLRLKTTFIEISFTDDGRSIESKLTDRGEVVFRIREPNPYPLLNHSGFNCQLFYLNQSAKTTFARRMGVRSVRFGSVFLFRNGFRVFPVGEDGTDWFGIDARKQQGYARFLGTRDVIGRLEVSGSEELFKEASSRNQGLIETAAVQQLRECFWEHCLKRLERYVVPVSWVDNAEKGSDDLSRLLNDSGRARVAAAVARLIDTPDVELIEYSGRLIGVLNERSNQFEESLASLRTIAEKTKDWELASRIEAAEARFEQLKSAESEALRIAETERQAREAAQALARAAEGKIATLTETLGEERKRTLFLTSITSLDVENVIEMHHQITIYAADLRQQVENCIAAAKAGEMKTPDLLARLEQVAFLNQKVLSISRLATKANFRLESDTIEADLAEYIREYVATGSMPFQGSALKVTATHSGGEFVRRFKPMEVAIVVDNLINNARKARATELRFDIHRSDKGTLVIDVQDNGNGLPTSADDLERLFDMGFSRTSGSGLGLYHVRQVLGEMGGGISAVSSDRGAHFVVRIST